MMKMKSHASCQKKKLIRPIWFISPFGPLFHCAEGEMFRKPLAIVGKVREVKGSLSRPKGTFPGPNRLSWRVVGRRGLSPVPRWVHCGYMVGAVAGTSGTGFCSRPTVSLSTSSVSQSVLESTVSSGHGPRKISHESL